MSHASSDGYERLLADFVEDMGNMQRDAVYQPIHHPPHTGLTIHPPPAPGSSTSTGGVGSSSTHTSRTKGSKTKAPKKSRRMAWLLIHNTGELQTLHLDKRMLVQVSQQLQRGPCEAHAQLHEGDQTSLAAAIKPRLLIGR